MKAWRLSDQWQRFTHRGFECVLLTFTHIELSNF